MVPLWWDAGTLEDLKKWNVFRQQQGAKQDECLIGSQCERRRGTRLSRHTLRKRFLTACKSLGADPVAMLTIHHGRQPFISHALAEQRTLAEVRDGAGAQLLVSRMHTCTLPWRMIRLGSCLRCESAVTSSSRVMFEEGARTPTATSRSGQRLVEVTS